MDKRIFNLIILDKSGSMFRLGQAPVDTVNETIESLRKEQKGRSNWEFFFSLVTFNDESNTVYDNVPINEANLMKDEEYDPANCTALYDAMGFAITHQKKFVSENDNVVVTIITDGYENASKEYSGDTIKKIVEELKTKGWVFTFIGANQDVLKAGSNISVDNVMAFDATDDGLRCAVNNVTRNRSRLFRQIDTGDFSSEDANRNFFMDEDTENVDKVK